MRNLVRAGALCIGLLALCACQSIISAVVPGAKTWTPAQDAHFEITVATEACTVANQVKGIAGVSAKVKADIQAAETGVYNTVTANVPVLMAGGSTGAQITAAGVAAIMPAVQSIGTIAQASGGTSVNPSAVAMAAGLATLEQAPAFVGEVSSLNGGRVIAQADIDAANVGFKAACGG